jgi:hypothetical protein
LLSAIGFWTRRALDTHAANGRPGGLSIDGRAGRRRAGQVVDELGVAARASLLVSCAARASLLVSWVSRRRSASPNRDSPQETRSIYAILLLSCAPRWPACW